MQSALASSLHDTYILLAVAAVVTLGIFLLFPKGKAEDLRVDAGETEGGTFEVDLVG
jgi:hypothetical protein